MFTSPRGNNKKNKTKVLGSYKEKELSNHTKTSNFTAIEMYGYKKHYCQSNVKMKELNSGNL